MAANKFASSRLILWTLVGAVAALWEVRAASDKPGDAGIHEFRRAAASVLLESCYLLTPTMPSLIKIYLSEPWSQTELVGNDLTLSKLHGCWKKQNESYLGKRASERYWTIGERSLGRSSHRQRVFLIYVPLNSAGSSSTILISCVHQRRNIFRRSVRSSASFVPVLV